MSSNTRFEATYPVAHGTLLAKVTLFLAEKGYPPSLVNARHTSHRIEYTQSADQHRIVLYFNPKIRKREPYGGYEVLGCAILGWDNGHSQSESTKPASPMTNVVVLSRHPDYDRLVSELGESLSQAFRQIVNDSESDEAEKGVPSASLPGEPNVPRQFVNDAPDESVSLSGTLESSEISDSVPRYGYMRDLTKKDVMAIVARSNTWRERGGTISGFWEEQAPKPEIGEPHSYALETLYAWRKDPKFNPNKRKRKT